MNIRIKDEQDENYIFQLGDVVVFRNGSEREKIVVHDMAKDQYILRSITSMFGATGYHKTLDELTASVNNLEAEYTLYKASEYELVLQRKEGY